MGVVNVACEANTASVISGDILRPLVGIWTADLVIDVIDNIGFEEGKKITITSLNGYSISGTIDQNRRGDFLDSIRLRVIGGADGMQKPTTARSFVQPGAYVRDVLNALASDTGETFSSTISQSLLLKNLAAWSLLGGDPAARNLSLLIEIATPTSSWRALSDGTLWIGDETWPALTGEFDILWQDPQDQSFFIGSESPFVEPGKSIASIGNIGRVQDIIEDGKMRTRIWVEIPGLDRGMAGSIASIARQSLAGIDFFATYLCEMVAQSSDLNSCDINPVGARNKALIGGLQRVPVRFGSGIKIKVVQGSTVLLGWDGGNPESPYVVSGFGGDTVQSIQLAGTTPVARKGDHSDGGTLVLTVTGSAVLSGTYTDPDGVPLTIASGTTIPLKAKLTEGSNIVEAG